MIRLLSVALAILMITGCAPAREPPPLTLDTELNGFVRDIERKLEAHAWDQLLAAADPAHRRTQVEQGGMSEAQYLAELFGLHHVDNNIRRGDRVEWADLERIRSVDLEFLDTAGPPHTLSGAVTLREGSTLTLQAQVDRTASGYVLTGAVG